MRAAMVVALMAGVGLAAATTPMTATAVDGAQCLNGATPYVLATVQAGVKDWVVQIGGDSVGLNICIDPAHCAMFAAPPTAPAPAPAPVAPPNSGVMSDDCTTNPVFCKYSRAQIPNCDFSLFIGDREIPANGSTPAMHFQGVKLLQASLKKLADLGMASAERVLLTGVGWGGTALILNADSIGVQLKTLVPTLKNYRALPVDGVHPKHGLVWITDVGGADALTGYLKSNFQQSSTGAALTPECKAKHPSDPWMCMYANETLPFTKTPIYLVNQLASIWDTQCDLDGMDIANILQIQCIPKMRNKQVFKWHECFQYIEKCDAEQITSVIAPFQQQYIDETLASGIMSRPGNGAFYHSCHLGAYWNTQFKGQGVWQHISIGGVTIEQGVATWWNAPATAASVFTKDCIWKASAVCNPTCAGFPPYAAAVKSEQAIVV